MARIDLPWDECTIEVRIGETQACASLASNVKADKKNADFMLKEFIICTGYCPK